MMGRRIFVTPLSRMAVVILGILVLTAFFAGKLAPQDPLAIDMGARLLGPGGSHLLGTDSLGRDFFSRMLYGGRISMLLALLLTTLSMTLGLAAGLAAGYVNGITDAIITGITNIFLGLPGLTLMIAVAGIMGPGLETIAGALTLTGWTGFSRVVRAEVIQLTQTHYVETARSMGSNHFNLIFRHILPGLGPICLVIFTTRVGRAMIAISSLSYLGFGLEPPAPDWGGMIRDAVSYFHNAPHLILAPGAAVFLFTFSVNILGDTLGDFFDVR